MSILRDLNRAYPTGGRIAEIPQAGIAGSLIPSDGVLGNDITLPADNAVLFRAEWLTTPSSGVFCLSAPALTFTKEWWSASTNGPAILR